MNVILGFISNEVIQSVLRSAVKNVKEGEELNKIGFYPQYTITQHKVFLFLKYNQQNVRITMDKELNGFKVQSGLTSRSIKSASKYVYSKGCLGAYCPLTTCVLLHSICGQNCFVLCELVAQHRGNVAEPDSNENKNLQSGPNVFYYMYYREYYRCRPKTEAESPVMNVPIVSVWI